MNISKFLINGQGFPNPNQILESKNQLKITLIDHHLFIFTRILRIASCSFCKTLALHLNTSDLFRCLYDESTLSQCPS